MAIFKKRDRAQRRIPQETEAIALRAAKDNYEFWGDPTYAYEAYKEVLGVANIKPDAYSVFYRKADLK